MKKNLFIMLGATLALVSCSNDEPINGGVPDGTKVDVNFSTLIPSSLDTRAYGNGQTAKELYYAVYDKDGNFLFEEQDQFPASALHKDVQIQLVSGETYQIVFWAQSADCKVYNFDAQNGVMTATYTATGDDATLNNNENLDAFYVAKTITVKADELNQTAELKRPLCQVNIATGDKEAAEKAGITFPTTSSVTFTEVPTTLNLLDGTLGTETTSVTFASNALPSDPAQITVAGNVYDALSMTYFLASAEGDVQSSVTMQVNNLTDGECSYSNITVKRNYKTNIVGNLLTSTTMWDVYIAPEFEGYEYNVFAAQSHIDPITGAVVCDKPTLPIGVTAEKMAENNASMVALDENGKPVYATSDKDVINMFKNHSTVWLAPNSAIKFSQAHLQIPMEGITIYGNGATISGGECDLKYSPNGLTAGQTVNIKIYDTNNLRVWGGCPVEATYNIEFNNCAWVGKGYMDDKLGFVMARGTANAAQCNITLKDCRMSDVHNPFHTIYGGKVVIDNCEFVNVGIPVNINNKGSKLDVEVKNCMFDNCGLVDGETDSDYAAQIRVVQAIQGLTTNVTVKNNTFKNGRGEWDVLLKDNREGKESYPVNVVEIQDGLKISIH